jgi:eukaryotic-like serine/threonine-protein kinase
MRITATNWNTISRLLDEALQLDPAARTSWLDSIAIEQPQMGEILRQLFADGGSLETADILPSLSGITPGQSARPGAAEFAVPAGKKFSAELGQYRVLELLGEGSMGDVYLAEQHTPVRRHVALKILKFGLNTQEVLGRFELERQTLALMTHPHIARVFDAGVTQDGRPYFAMEYVPGAALTQYCDARQLDLDARLRLFGQVCSGVQHAHLRGVIHRDLKPSNILITEIDGVPTPKIIDFGIAKAATVSGIDMQTRLGHILGTPEYMSPEQVQLSPLEIDLRTDVYSLGIVLYELLTGSRPYHVTRDAITPAVLERQILSHEAVLPSARAAERTLEGIERAEQRRSIVQALAARLRGDLDWITLKALEKDRNRRYVSAAELGADIERHIRHEAVLAGPPSAIYRLRKLARRHRIAAATLGVLFVTAIIFGSGMGWLAHKASLERDRANNEALLARRVTAFTAGLFELANPMSIGSKDVTARELLDVGVARLETQMGKDQPFVRAALFQAAGNAYRGLGAYDRAERMLKSAVELRTTSAREPAAYAQTLLDMALVRREQGDFAASEQMVRDAVRVLEAPSVSASDIQRRARLDLVEILRLRSKFDEAAQLAEQIVRADEQSGHIHTSEHALAMRMLGRTRAAQGRFPEAEQLLRRSLALHREIDGELGEATIEARSALADALTVMGEPLPAVPILREIVRDVRAIYGERHPEVGIAYNNLANALSDIPETYAEGIDVYRKALDIQLEINGPVHPEVATVYNNLGATYLKLKEWRKADAEFQKAVAIRTEVLGPSDPNTASAQDGRALALNKLGEYTQAEALLRQAKAIQTSRLGAGHWRTANVQHHLAIVLMNERRFAESERELREAHRIHVQVLGAKHPRTQAVEQTFKDLEQSRLAAKNNQH